MFMQHRKHQQQQRIIHQIPKLTLLVASMATFFLLTFLCFYLLSSTATITDLHPFPNLKRSAHPIASWIQPGIKQACMASRYPDTCQSSLQLLPNCLPLDRNPISFVHSSICLSAHNLKIAQSMVTQILNSSPASNPNRQNAASSCMETLTNSERRISSTIEALSHGRTKDARAWMSAALAYNYDCWSALKYVNETQLVNQTMSFLDTLIIYDSNALSMVAAYDIYGKDDVSSWKPPRTERDGFWEASGPAELGFKGGLPAGLKADVTVCGEGCDFKKVQDAVDAAPSDSCLKKFVIWIKEGVYEEIVRVGLEKKNVVFLGDGAGKTVITGSLNAGLPGVSTYNSATVGVLGDGFMARGITFQNTAGPDVHQAVAFRSDSDQSVIESCEFLGNQDTLYAHSLRQFYKSCHIEGNVDFIFGNSAAIFQDCTILVRPRQVHPEKGENNAITAQGRTDPAQTTGFVFQNCLVNGTDEYMRLYRSKPRAHKNFLGRPWKEYSRTVFIHCNLEALIMPQGWLPWKGDFALKTLFYGEFENSGAGSDTSQRVNWSTQIPADHVYIYSADNFIQGSEWIPTSS
uniref:pectinesterase n=1 Tax=Kalanchoe fedtschenkoi TaxID=63787 RepID=A0A7N0TRM9_KALFE